MDYVINGLKLVTGLIAFMIVIRALGKKHLAEMTPYDMIYLLMFGGILEETLYNPKISIWQFLFSLGVWVAAIYVIEKLVTKSNKVRALLKGEPDHLIVDGEINLHLMNKNQLEMEQLRTMLRQQGIFSLREVKDLFLEPGGDISINQYAKYKPVTCGDLDINKREDSPSVLLIDEGQIQQEVLHAIGKTELWLRQELTREGFSDPHDVIYCEWSKSDGFFIK
ncbi:DUF421 domain-containing protein [Sporosarcina sp. NCCP-2222]|uniref:DUF421 domain-containing protein n=1 Tax=Sporosarcina sp. NCCP-2222 TaxID=2935073 RepID=UPI00207F50D9|nr:DUF421 domain-containing protein [Sporosarcina sp. NCCP-2222]GKV57450.1 DUF421 domain-containing protein [Sporosarcina sp. NCCP-2222]